MIDFKFIKELEFENGLKFYGNFDIDSSPKAAIFNSRQSKTPTGSDLWVVNTLRAVKSSIEKEYIVLTSLGMNTWELLIWACSEFGGKQIVIFPAVDDSEKETLINKICYDFNLDESRTGWLFFKPTAKARSSKADWPRRDKIAFKMADLIMSVSVRAEGNLDTLIRNQKEKPIINDFHTSYKTKTSAQAFKADKIVSTIPIKGWNYITHWTRSCYGPWPAEKPGAFYKRLAISNNIYPGNALETLKNILKYGRIRGSSRHLREGTSGVAFSSLHPAKILPLMRWRKRYVRWGFEPYGIAIEREAAIRSGIQPVIYSKPELYGRLKEHDKPYFQNEGESGAWRDEHEWRYIGDFDLSGVSSDNLTIITFKQDEIGQIRDVTPAMIISMT
jgi:hypothetical protein